MKVLSISVDTTGPNEIVNFCVVETTATHPRSHHGKMPSPSYAEVRTRVQKYMADNKVDEISVELKSGLAVGLFDMLEAQINTIPVRGH